MQGIKEEPKRGRSNGNSDAMRRMTPGEFAQKAVGTEDYGNSLNDRAYDDDLEDLSSRVLTAKDYKRRQPT